MILTDTGDIITPDELPSSISDDEFLARASDDTPATDTRACRECGNTFHVRTGPGRKPVICQDCKAIKAQTDTVKPRTSRRGNTNVSKDATALVAKLGALIALRDLFDGAVVIDSAEDVGKYLGELSIKYPAIRKFIESTNSVGLYGDGVMLALSIIAPIAWHHNIAGLKDRLSLDVIEKFGGRVPQMAKLANLRENVGGQTVRPTGDSPPFYGQGENVSADS